MRLTLHLLGLPFIDLATGSDVHADQPSQNGAEASTERRGSPDATWADGPGIPDDRMGFRA